MTCWLRTEKKEWVSEWERENCYQNLIYSSSSSSTSSILEAILFAFIWSLRDFFLFIIFFFFILVGSKNISVDPVLFCFFFMYLCVCVWVIGWIPVSTSILIVFSVNFIFLMFWFDNRIRLIDQYDRLSMRMWWWWWWQLNHWNAIISFDYQNSCSFFCRQFRFLNEKKIIIFWDFNFFFFPLKYLIIIIMMIQIQIWWSNDESFLFFAKKKMRENNFKDEKVKVKR